MRNWVSVWMCVVILAGVCGGRVITVDEDGPADFNNIRAAVEDANNGDTVVILPGLYRGTNNCGIDLEIKSLTIRSQMGPESVEIDCEGESYGIYIRDNRYGVTRIEGLTIRGAMYGAIKCYSSTPPHAPLATLAYTYTPGYMDVVISDCRLVENTGSAFLLDGHDNVTLIGCEISDNTGTGLYSYMSGVTLKNCIIARNGSGGISATYPNLIHCTVVANAAHGVSVSDGLVEGCIVHDNGMDQIHNRLERIVVVYSNVEEGWPGEGNIDADPCFADPNTGDYHLKSQAGRWLADEARWVTDEATSPCIDTGDPMKPVGPESFPNGGRVNMGAYGGTEQASRSYFGVPICETIIPGDINGDCRADFRDLAIMLSHWLWNDTPSASIISPTPEEAIGSYQANDPIRLVAEASDSGAAIENVEFFIDGSAVGQEIGLVGQDTDGTDGWSFDWIWWGDWGSYPEGYYTVTAQATDESGTVGISRPIRFSVHGPK